MAKAKKKSKPSPTTKAARGLATSKPTPAAAYDGAPERLADGAPVFVRWDVGSYKLGILTNYTAAGKPVVRVLRVDPKGRYTGEVGKEPRTFEPGEVSRVYMERDWECMTRPTELTKEQALAIMMRCAKRSNDADVVARLGNPEVIARSQWMIDAVILAANGGEGLHGHVDFDARMSRGPANDELQRPRAQYNIDNDTKQIDVGDIDVAEDVVDTILENRPVHIETLRSLARWVGTCHGLIKDWKERAEAFESEVEDLSRPSRARADEVDEPVDPELPPRKNDIIILMLPRKQAERAKVTMVADGEVHFVCIDGNGGSRALGEEGKTWQRDPDATAETFDRAVADHESRTKKTTRKAAANDGLAIPREGYGSGPSTPANATPSTPAATTTMPARGDKIEIRTGAETWSKPIDVLRIDRDQMLFGRLGSDPKADRIDGAYRVSNEGTHWRRIAVEKPAPVATVGGNEFPISPVTPEDPRITPGVNTPHALLEVGSAMEIKVGRRWSRVTITSVGSMLINFNHEDGKPGTVPWDDEGKLWRRCAAAGSLTSTEIEVLAEKGKWVKGVITANDADKVMVSFRLRDLARTEMLNVGDEGKTWRRLGAVTPAARDGAPSPGDKVEVKVGRTWEPVTVWAVADDAFSFRGEDGTPGNMKVTEKRWRRSSRSDAPAAAPNQVDDLARAFEQGRRAVDRQGTDAVEQVVDRTVNPRSPVDRAVANGNANVSVSATGGVMSLHKRNQLHARRLGISLDEVIRRRDAGTLAPSPEDLEADAEGRRANDRARGGLDNGGMRVVSETVGEPIEESFVDEGPDPDELAVASDRELAAMGKRRDADGAVVDAVFARGADLDEPAPWEVVTPTPVDDERPPWEVG